jgi:hypothetical protein
MRPPLNFVGKWHRMALAGVVFLVSAMFASYTNASPLTTFSSPIPNSPASLIPQAWLPAMINSYPWVKIKSGIHLGNRSSSDNTNDWNVPMDYLARLRGTAQGPWPAAIVVLSDQVYYVRRNDAACNVTSVDVKNNYVFDYLNQAAAHGTKIVFRIYPSPGNFTDALQPQQGSLHMLLPNSGDKPAIYKYCDNVVRNDGKSGKAFEFFRSIDDIANEMKAIHDYNYIHAGAITPQEFFLPANEPNNEWYRAWYNPSVIPLQDNSTAWGQMDTYFSNLYDRAKNLNSAIRVLTPAMSQGLSAERVVFGTCGNNALIVNGVPTEAAGYDFMETTYRYKNNGIAWNNYWSQAEEFWSDNFCGSPSNQTSHHVAQYLPT